MIIERFFGKGRAEQPEAQPPQPPTPAQKKSPASKADEPKPRRPSTPAAGVEATARRNEPTPKPVSHARPGGPAVAEPACSGAKAVAALPPSYEEIAARAYDVWVARGRPEGRDQENWAEAERQLNSERARC
jgi:hypothetical protein